MMIKTTLLLIAAAGLTGCAVYPAYPAAPYGAVYEPAPVYVTPAPVFIGGAVHLGHPRGYSRPHPHGHRPHHPHLHRPGRHHH
ncbi:hypothetical protein [Polaromonas sp.]|uniref:hypothetical protein n=1 Tax=Polaromonas sp. TaxID=1869339 RepID=UPI003752342B